MTLVPGREYPKYVYHVTKPPFMVHSAQERAKLGSEWSDTYIHQPYPKCKYHWTGEMIKVQNADEEAALEKGWADTPGAFEPYKGSRQPKTQDQDPVKWVDAWVVADLSSEHRNRIKAQLLRADAAYWSSPDAASADMNAMRQAFTGVAKVLAEAGILTGELLNNEIPTLVWDSAIAGGWYRFASETPQDIFPEQLGHHWVWRDGERDWKSLFYAENREWLAWLLENPTKDAGDPRVPVRRTRAESVPGQMELPPRPQSNPAAEGGGDAATAPGEQSVSSREGEFASDAPANNPWPPARNCEIL